MKISGTKTQRGDTMAGGKHLLGKPRGKHIFGTAKVGEKGQIVIPKEARQIFGVQPGDTVWDVGAGTGAVTFELARKAMDGAVFAVERNTEAIELIAQNRQKLGGFNVHIVQGHAPEVLADLPKPNCVFVGGSGGNIREIIEIALMKNPKARIAVNAIALETLQETQRLFAEFGLQQVEITQLSAARGKSIGCYTMMTANNPVFILSGKGDKYGE